jgi:hypothetical protein
MFNFFSCKHEWSKWEVTKRLSDKYGSMIFYQERYCVKCNLHQFKKTEL